MSDFNFKVGDTIAGVNWSEDEYIIITAIGKKGFLATNSQDYESRWIFDEYKWILRTPPKRKVKMWKWVFRNTQGAVFDTDRYFRNECSALDVLGLGAEIVCRLDSSEIEVEESA